MKRIRSPKIRRRLLLLAFTAASTANLLTAVANPSRTEADCKDVFYTVLRRNEQAVVDAQGRLVALLRDPARATPELERRLRKQVRYSNGLLLIEDPILHGVTTLPATAGWAIDCDMLGVRVTFGATGENGRGTEVELVPLGTMHIKLHPPRHIRGSWCGCPAG